MRIIIVGIGKVGYMIAENLSDEGHGVTVIDTDEDALRRADEALDVLCVKGNGPIDAFFNAIHGRKLDRFTFVDYSEHAITDGSDSRAVAYIHLRSVEGDNVFGVGISHNINLAPLRGIISAINRWHGKID